MDNRVITIRVPPIVSLETAVRLYYEKLELGNAELRELFGARHSPKTFARLKEYARARMKEHNIDTYGLYTVNTKAAYEAWGLNIADLETRYQKLRKLSMLPTESAG
jgi:hypothetical protein